MQWSNVLGFAVLALAPVAETRAVLPGPAFFRVALVLASDPAGFAAVVHAPALVVLALALGVRRLAPHAVRDAQPLRRAPDLAAAHQPGAVAEAAVLVEVVVDTAVVVDLAGGGRRRRRRLAQPRKRLAAHGSGSPSRRPASRPSGGGRRSRRSPRHSGTGKLGARPAVVAVAVARQHAHVEARVRHRRRAGGGVGGAGGVGGGSAATAAAASAAATAAAGGRSLVAGAVARRRRRPSSASAWRCQ